MTDRKFQIFISSTYEDLKEERDSAMSAILSLHHFPIGMEMFNANDDSQWKVIQSSIDSSDYYILIIGYRYGSKTNKGISYTEKEYEYAKKQKKTVLVFIREKDVAVKQSYIDSEPSDKEKLEAFIKKATKNAVVKFWKTKDDLTLNITTALSLKFPENKNGGWVRSSELPSLDVINEMTRLSKENNELRKELEAIKKNQKQRKPFLEVQLIIQKVKSWVEEKEVVISEEKFFRTIQGDDFQHFINWGINQEACNTYNNYIKNNTNIIDNYNNFLLRDELINLNAVKLNVLIRNTGNHVGKNVAVEIEFPPELVVFLDRKDVVIHKALEPETKNVRYQLERNLEKSRQSLRNFDDFGSLFLNAFKTLKINHTKFTSVDYSNNSLLIEGIDILHTKEFLVEEESFIAPIKKGTFLCKATIICEELESPQTMEITVVVD